MILPALFLCLFGFALKAADESEMSTLTDDKAFYSALTNSAEFTYKPVYQPVSFTANEWFEDVKVTAVESIPFGFFLTYAGIWVFRAIQNGTFTPNIGSVESNENIFVPAIAAFATVNVAINLFTYYDYKKDYSAAPAGKK